KLRVFKACARIYALLPVIGGALILGTGTTLSFYLEWLTICCMWQSTSEWFHPLTVVALIGLLVSTESRRIEMQVNMRREPRHRADKLYAICWHDDTGR